MITTLNAAILLINISMVQINPLMKLKKKTGEDKNL